MKGFKTKGITLSWVSAALTGALVWGCSVRRAPDNLGVPAPCFAEAQEGEVAEPSFDWVIRTDPAERSALDAWCWGVGPPLLSVSAAATDAALDSLAVIVWNTHVGEGDFRALITDLRSGRLTGSPVQHFVMLLQEVHRGGNAVPAQVPGFAAVARWSGDGERQDATQLAGEYGLSVLYAPSMRNGPVASGVTPEDRGNAILSTLPLQSPELLELPYERQRRVAVAARVTARTSSGTPWTLRLVSAHFDNRARFGRIFRSFGALRSNQARALAEQLSNNEPTLLGADLNTWIGGEAARLLRAALPQPQIRPEQRTVPLPGPIPDLRLDYLFAKLPPEWRAEYRVVEDTYGSDHRPLLGWVALSAPAVGQQTAAR
jgi:endonuclease/exonuclease/phosphatase family metal-dependent hydrolase